MTDLVLRFLSNRTVEWRCRNSFKYIWV